MKKHNLRFSLIIFLFTIFSGIGYTQNFGSEVLKHSNLTVSCPFSITMGELHNYSKGNLGLEVRIGTELMNFKIQKTPVSMGLCTTYNYNKYLFVREEIRNFYSNCFLEGIWFQFPIWQDLMLQAELNLGLAITKAKALSIEGKSLENYYNSLVVGTTVVAVKKIYQSKNCQFNGTGGLELRGYIEQDSGSQTLGIKAGIMIKGK